MSFNSLAFKKIKFSSAKLIVLQELMSPMILEFFIERLELTVSMNNQKCCIVNNNIYMIHEKFERYQVFNN